MAPRKFSTTENPALLSSTTNESTTDYRQCFTNELVSAQAKTQPSYAKNVNTRGPQIVWTKVAFFGLIHVGGFWGLYLILSQQLWTAWVFSKSFR